MNWGPKQREENNVCLQPAQSLQTGSHKYLSMQQLWGKSCANWTAFPRAKHGAEQSPSYITHGGPHNWLHLPADSNLEYIGRPSLRTEQGR